jgi:HSP20 family protein
MRFDPFREMDRLMEQLAGGAARTSRSFPMDAYQRGEELTIHLDLPGMDPDTIDLTTDQHVLTIKAERTFPREEGDEIIVQERPQGRFTRQLFLGDTLDIERLEAHYDQGVLTVTIPVAEQAKPRRIQVAAGAGRPRTIEGTATPDAERFDRSEQSTEATSSGVPGER